jgi:hypothetical protein
LHEEELTRNEAKGRRKAEIRMGNAEGISREGTQRAQRMKEMALLSAFIAFSRG